MNNYKKFKENQDDYAKKHVEHEELVECYVYFVFALIIAALVLTILEWIG
jgi:hypothetical protein